MMLLDDSKEARISLQQRAFLVAIFTFVILVVFQPFGTFESEFDLKYLKLSGYALATFFAVMLAGLIEIQLFKIKHRIPYYPFAILILYIGLGAFFNHSYFVVAILEQWHWQNQLMFVLYVSAIALFPMSFIYLTSKKIINVHEEKQASDETQTATDPQAIDKPQATNTQSQKIILSGENKSDELELDANQVVAFKSADNYCEVITLEAGQYVTHLIRLPLSSALTQLPDENSIMRCHRSWAVNVTMVDSVTGNSNGLKLKIESLQLQIPVSRAYVSTIKTALSFTTQV